jgi:N4-(beta-N-acetylglucosaminyl)-L-asparaginase
MNKAGEAGGYAIQRGFSYAVCDAKNQSALIPSASVFPA